MISNPACPTCNGTDPTVIGAQVFRKADIAQLSDYLKLRYRVLFELWAPRAEEVRFQIVLCRDCGLVFHSPRATVEDLDAKYKFLTQSRSAQDETDHGASTAKRAVRLFANLRPHLAKRTHVNVLDFGGGDGRLMRPFVQAGARVDLIDYVATPIQGVRKIGDTAGSLADADFYDLIICSHVIEHVADPSRLIGTLIAHLKPDGVIYVEVPMEVWGGAPMVKEPVTHVNFFTPGSLRHLLRRTGGQVIQCGLASQPHDSGRTQLVVTALARISAAGPDSKLEAVDVFRFLAPTLVMKVHRRLLMPNTIMGAIRHKLGLA